MGMVVVVGDWPTDMHMAPEIAISVVFIYFFSFFLVINNAFFSVWSLCTHVRFAEVNSRCKLSHANKSKSS